VTFSSHAQENMLLFRRAIRPTSKRWWSTRGLLILLLLLILSLLLSAPVVVSSALLSSHQRSTTKPLLYQPTKSSAPSCFHQPNLRLAFLHLSFNGESKEDDSIKLNQEPAETSSSSLDAHPNDPRAFRRLRQQSRYLRLEQEEKERKLQWLEVKRQKRREQNKKQQKRREQQDEGEEQVSIRVTSSTLDQWTQTTQANKLSLSSLSSFSSSSSSSSASSLLNPAQTLQQQQQQPPLVQTLPGGPNLIFEMARKMLVWEQEDWEAAVVNQAVAARTAAAAATTQTTTSAPRRWHPTLGISDDNPQFRTQPPVMNSQGYAGMIWRNVRKRSKTSMWRYALRTYDRMKVPVVAESSSTSSSNAEDTDAETNGVRRTNIHHEGAMVACAKLGEWQRALEIFATVQQEQEAQNPSSETLLSSQSKKSYQQQPLVQQQPQRNNNNQRSSPFSYRSNTSPSQPAFMGRKKNGGASRSGGGDEDDGAVHVTDNMVLSLIRACVRGARQMRNEPIERRREPLDAAVAILTRGYYRRWDHHHPSPAVSWQSNTDTVARPTETSAAKQSALESRYNLPLVARHLNPLAAAYQAMGLPSAAAELLQQHLSDRTSGPEFEDGLDPFNVNDVNAKDKAAYSLLVRGAVSDGDWAGAIDALRDMTDAGLFPASRHLNSWTEVSERKTKQRTTRSWKKKRDEFWLESVQ